MTLSKVVGDLQLGDQLKESRKTRKVLRLKKPFSDLGLVDRNPFFCSSEFMAMIESLYIPKSATFVPFHQKNVQTGRTFTYPEDPGIITLVVHLNQVL